MSFLTNSRQLDRLLPPGLERAGEPVITVTASYITEIEWLAGRGYNTLGVTFPVVFEGTRDQASGNFLAVLWENLTDPIITGREELGYPKIYGELPEPRTLGDRTECIANWMGFNFMHMSSERRIELSEEEVEAVAAKQAGVLLLKYMPRTGDWGEQDASYVTYTPPMDMSPYVKRVWRCEGTVEFHHASWEDLPTMFNVVNMLQELEVVELRGATEVTSVGGVDYRQQRILR